MKRYRGGAVIDRVVHRVLGAVRLVDATVAQLEGVSRQLVVTEPVAIRAAELTFRRNRRNYYVIHRSSHPLLRAHHDQFEAPPALPAIGSLSFAVEVVPSTGSYLPRVATIALPRDPDPAAVNSLFTPLDLRLYRAPTAVPLAGWGAVRVTVRDAEGAGVPGALVRVVAADDATNLMGEGITEWRGRARGEALVPIAKIPTTSVAANGTGPVISQGIAIAIQAFYHPGFDPETALPDPDDLEARRQILVAAPDPDALGAFLVASGVVNRVIRAGEVIYVVL
ncbi:hypothetical protein EYB53_016655 [Candidatus Chloroploca sp. M-50]|uniref:Uncharacterized protein n=1 Tax=Candidatus Chloroploca mongolica TaxID=2528176 RepID=A0ABS4DD19_9CHLR|nr:hypothetical protein [Candidatus Chloroploca mongolica]MBP1467345.1 hypothetical protein [Candidatus Chloroploca mongolica]